MNLLVFVLMISVLEKGLILVLLYIWVLILYFVLGLSFRMRCIVLDMLIIFNFV